MKKIIPILFCLACMAGCKNEDKKNSSTDTATFHGDTTSNGRGTVRKDTAVAETVKLDTACITGTFRDKSEAALLVNPRKIILKRDGTGEDIYTLEDRRPIRWSLKNGRLYIHSRGEPKGSAGTEAYINCKSNELSIYGYTFGKN